MLELECAECGDDPFRGGSQLFLEWIDWQRLTPTPDAAEFAVQREPGTPDCVDEMSAVRFPHHRPRDPDRTASLRSIARA